ncbi:hypothetical protein H4I95_03004 [Botrytis cinerea]
MGIFDKKKGEQKKSHGAAQAVKISRPIKAENSMMFHEESDTSNPTQQHARNPDAPLTIQVIHQHPITLPAMAIPTGHLKTFPDQSPTIPTKQAKLLHTQPRGQNHPRPTKRNAGNSSSSRPSSAHSGASSANGPLDDTEVTSQRGSRASSGSRHSSPPSSSDENPFKYDDGRYASVLK